VVAKEDQEVFRRRYGANLAFMNVQVCEGGKERHDSIAGALAIVKEEAEFVAVHDAVRPCLTNELVDTVFSEAAAKGAALLAVSIADTLKKATPQQKVEATMPRQGLWLAQTPQVFRKEWLREAYAQRAKVGKDITDDSQLVEALGHPVFIVDGSPTNIKITTKGDLFLAEAILKSRPKPKGQGPAHPFADEAQW
jgi:2-C-methyl-D-erythritol 4-phosphate cytidylyltransferase